MGIVSWCIHSELGSWAITLEQGLTGALAEIMGFSTGSSHDQNLVKTSTHPSPSTTVVCLERVVLL